MSCMDGFRRHVNLPDTLFCSVRPGERRIGARLAVVVTLVLVTPEEPQTIAHDRAAEAGREIAVPLPLVPARPSAGVGDGPHDRLTRPRGRLPVVRRVELEEIAALFGDDVEDGALHVAVLDRRARRLNLDLLNRVDARLRARHALARAREVRAVDEELVLVDARPERGDGVDAAAGRRRGRHAGRRPNHVEHAVASRWNVAQLLLAESRRETALARPDQRPALDDERLGDAGHPEHWRQVEGHPGANRDVLHAVWREPRRQLDDERVRSGREDRKSHVAPVVRRGRERAADERGR